MRIGEVARRSGVSARMLRHYEQRGLVEPSGRTVAGYREYADDDLRRIFAIECLRSLGLSLQQVQQALDDPGFAPDALVADLIEATEGRLRREQELLDRLRTVSSSAPQEWGDVLRIVALLRDLTSPSAQRRQRTALASGAAGAVPVPVTAIADAILTEADQAVANTLRWALGQSLARTSADTEPVVRTLGTGLRSPEPEVRSRAVRALAELDHPAARTLLTTALTDEVVMVTAPAALALGRLGHLDAIPALVRMITSGHDDVPAAEALAVVAARDPEAVMVALEPLAGNPDPAVRGRLAQALAELPAPERIALLERLAGDPDRVVAGTATAVLSTMR